MCSCQILMLHTFLFYGYCLVPGSRVRCMHLFICTESMNDSRLQQTEVYISLSVYEKFLSSRYWGEISDGNWFWSVSVLIAFAPPPPPTSKNGMLIYWRSFLIMRPLIKVICPSMASGFYFLCWKRVHNHALLNKIT